MQFVLLVLGVALFSGFSPAHAEPPTDAKTELYRGGDVVVKQFVTPGFEALPLDRKLFVYYLSLATDAGRDIDWSQQTRGGLELRFLLEGLWRNSWRLTPAKRAQFAEYFFKVLANHGNYDENKNLKIPPEGFDFSDLAELAALTDSTEADPHHTTPYRSLLQKLRREIFDLDYFPTYLAPKGADTIAGGAAGFYGNGVTKADLDALPEKDRRNFLSYPVKGPDGKVTLEIEKIGGRFDTQLRVVDHYFELAKVYANREEQKIITAYQKALHTGDPQDLLAAERLWAAYKPRDVSFMIGFVETYHDPIDIRGQWTGFVMVLGGKTGNVSEAVRKNVDYFESMMPVDPRFKKDPGFTPPWATGAYLTYTGGMMGERPFAGVNIPNDPDIREKIGSNSFTAINVVDPIGGKNEADEKMDSVFFSPKYVERLKKFDQGTAHAIQVVFHEILGHGSGRYLPGVTKDMQGVYGSPLEEARAETASLYQLLDPKLREMGVLPSMSDAEYREFQELSVVFFFQRHLNSFYRLSETTTAITQAHQWARHTLLNWMLEDGALVVWETGDGIPHVEVADLAKCRASLGRLWARIQEYTSTGNAAAAGELLRGYGKYTDRDKAWRNAVVAARKRLNLPSEPAYLNPTFELVKQKGQVVDVAIRYNRVRRIEDFINLQVKRSRNSETPLRICGEALRATPKRYR